VYPHVNITRGAKQKARDKGIEASSEVKNEKLKVKNKPPPPRTGEKTKELRNERVGVQGSGGRPFRRKLRGG